MPILRIATTGMLLTCMTALTAAPAGADTGTTTATAADGATIAFEDLNFMAQVGVLEEHCTALSSGTIIFTCEDELQWAGQLSAPMEIVYQLVDLSNLVLENAASVETLSDALVDETSNAVLELTGGPALENYMAGLTADQGAGEEMTLDELAQFNAGPISIEADTPDGRLVFFPSVRAIIAKARCGYFGNNRPRRAVTPINDGKLQNPEGYLRSLGYHRTPASRIFGGGWTKPQTYNSFFCGYGTFRDHGQIILCGTTNNIRACNVVRQEYTDSPYGEPNPEVWRSGPWPYQVWPAYVYYWHRVH